jgi:hypothetical protein
MTVTTPERSVSGLSPIPTRPSNSQSKWRPAISSFIAGLARTIHTKASLSPTCGRSNAPVVRRLTAPIAGFRWRQSGWTP